MIRLLLLRLGICLKQLLVSTLPLSPQHSDNLTHVVATFGLNVFVLMPTHISPQPLREERDDQPLMSEGRQFSRYQALSLPRRLTSKPGPLRLDSEPTRDARRSHPSHSPRQCHRVSLAWQYTLCAQRFLSCVTWFTGSMGHRGGRHIL